MTESEKRLAAAVRLQETLLDECERAATDEGNTRVLAASQVRRFNELRLQAIRERWAADGLEVPPIPVMVTCLKCLVCITLARRIVGQPVTAAKSLRDRRLLVRVVRGWWNNRRLEPEEAGGCGGDRDLRWAGPEYG